MTTQEWIEKTKGMDKLLEDLICHVDNASPKDFKRMFAISIRQYLMEFKEIK